MERTPPRGAARVERRLPPDAFANAWITIPSVDNDLFILEPSFNRNPFDSAFDCLSLPAKSTRLILLTLAVTVVEPDPSVCRSVIVKMACDRLDVSFIAVLAV